jgi:hypothetical protein
MTCAEGPTVKLVLPSIFNPDMNNFVHLLRNNISCLAQRFFPHAIIRKLAVSCVWIQGKNTLLKFVSNFSIK